MPFSCRRATIENNSVDALRRERPLAAVSPRDHSPSALDDPRGPSEREGVKISKGKRVRLKIHLTTADGKELEKSAIEFIFGGGKMLAGIEELLDGLEAGAKKKGTLPAKKAFGNPAAQSKMTMKRSEFPADASLALGSKFTAKGPDGKTDVVLQIDKVTIETVDVRLVHPLAEADLKYDLEVLAVTDPAPPPVPAAALDLEES
jgi:FKBP-type peptidyl-prolyl cis-trans isomerase 2